MGSRGCRWAGAALTRNPRSLRARTAVIQAAGRRRDRDDLASERGIGAGGAAHAGHLVLRRAAERTAALGPSRHAAVREDRGSIADLADLLRGTREASGAGWLRADVDVGRVMTRARFLRLGLLIRCRAVRQDLSRTGDQKSEGEDPHVRSEARTLGLRPQRRRRGQEDVGLRSSHARVREPHTKVPGSRLISVRATPRDAPSRTLKARRPRPIRAAGPWSGRRAARPCRCRSARRAARVSGRW